MEERSAESAIGSIQIVQPISIPDLVVFSALVGKGLFILTFVIFVIFSFVLVRQVSLMDQTIKTPLAPFLKLISLALLLVTSGLLFLVIIAA